jgi:uncharacterized membrane protein (UPF0127 family)
LEHVSVAWLVRGEDVLAAAELADSRRAKRRGLLGRDGIEGVFVLRGCRSVHTLGMRFPIDVAFCDRSGKVVHTTTLPPWRVSKVVPRAAFVIEAEAGSLDRWKVKVGDEVEVRA